MALQMSIKEMLEDLQCWNLRYIPRDRQLIIIILCLRTLLAFCRHT